MTKFNVIFHDVSENLKSKVQPVFQVPRPFAGQNEDLPPKPFAVAQPGRVGTFWVPTNPILDRDQGWVMTAKGDHVRVPMFSYKTSSPSKARLVASGMELGWRALAGLLPLQNMEPIEVTLFLGHECHHTEAGYDYYVGLMIRTQ